MMHNLFLLDDRSRIQTAFSRCGLLCGLPNATELTKSNLPNRTENETCTNYSH